MCTIILIEVMSSWIFGLLSDLAMRLLPGSNILELNHPSAFDTGTLQYIDPWS